MMIYYIMLITIKRKSGISLPALDVHGAHHFRVDDMDDTICILCEADNDNNNNNNQWDIYMICKYMITRNAQKVQQY